MNNIILTQNIEKRIRVASATSLTLSFSNIDYYNVNISANEAMVLSNIPTGRYVYIRVYNSHATNLVTITNPTASNWILQRGLTTVSLLAGEYVLATVYYDGTNYELIYGEAMVKNA